MYLLAGFHVLGHLAAARVLGIPTRFRLGWGPTLVEGERWSIAVLPGVFADPEPEPFEAAPFGARLGYLAAGPIAAGAAGVAIAWALLVLSVLGPDQEIRPPPPSAPAIVGDLMPGGPAERAGLQVEDRIVALGDREVMRWDELRAAVAEFEGGDVQVDVRRGGSAVSVTVSPDWVESEAGMRPVIGVVPKPILTPVNRSVGEANAYALSVFGRVGGVFEALVTGSIQPRALGGPVAAVPQRSLGRQIPMLAGMSFLRATLLITLWNLLPLPWSDALTAVAEGVRSATGRRLPLRVIAGLGLVIAAIPMILVFAMDLIRYLG